MLKTVASGGIDSLVKMCELLLLYCIELPTLTARADNRSGRSGCTAAIDPGSRNQNQAQARQEIR
ncbi:MAG: hypothetical protein F6K28_47095 [Microcoleus sp. SIO2G3]|nr:hypothetical protein [Microcoleus sp. SIO2G3]